VVNWFWMNVPLMLVFFGLWVGVPLWLVLTRWDKETKARHAEVAAWHAHIAAKEALAAVPILPAEVAEAGEIVSPAYAGVAGEH
jgi:hypothetical protein